MPTPEFVLSLREKIGHDLLWLMGVSGYVEDEQGRVLLGRRSDTGEWAMVYGINEPGEEPADTVAREVKEETGVDDLSLGDLICVTDHCYKRNGIWHLKHTWWYRMYYLKPLDLTPQTEEDITKAAWVAKSSLPPFLKNTYPSIKEVFLTAS